MAVLRYLVAWAGFAALFVFLRPDAPDPTAWLDAAYTMRGGDTVVAPPMWPVIALFVAFLGNIGVPEAGMWIAMVAAGGVPPIAMALARRLQLSRAAAFTIGLTAAVSVMPFAHLLAPHALFAFLLMMVIATGLEWEAEPDDPARMITWLFCALLTALTHEVGVLVLWTAALACAGRSFPRAAAETAVATLTVLLFTMVAGRMPALPARLAEPLAASPWSAGQWERMPDFFERFLTVPHGAAWIALAGVVGAAFAWSWVRRKRYGEPTRPQPWALLSALSPAFAALVVWTGPRDLLVVVPAAAIGVGVCVAALGEWRERLAVPAHALVVAALLVTIASAW